MKWDTKPSNSCVSVFPMTQENIEEENKIRPVYTSKEHSAQRRKRELAGEGVFAPTDLVKVACMHGCSVASVMSNSLRPHGLYPPGSSVHGILQVRILEWITIPFSRGSSWPRDLTYVSCVSCIAGRFFTAEPPWKPPIKVGQVKWITHMAPPSLLVCSLQL